MEEIWIFVAASLVLGGMIGAILALVKEKRDKTWKEKLTTQTTPPPPPPQLPPRRNTPTASQSLNEASPSRSSSASAIAEASKRGLDSGPRGILPNQFPCCPFCKQRNTFGTQQKIFWDSDEEVYHCSREHRFQKNGKPL